MLLQLQAIHLEFLLLFLFFTQSDFSEIHGKGRCSVQWVYLRFSCPWTRWAHGSWASSCSAPPHSCSSTRIFHLWNAHSDLTKIWHMESLGIGVVNPEPHSFGCPPGSGSVLGMRIWIRIQWKLTKIYKQTWCPAFQKGFYTGTFVGIYLDLVPTLSK